MGRQEHQTFLLPDLTDAAFPVRHIILRNRKVIGKVKYPVHRIFSLFGPFRAADVFVDFFPVKTVLPLIKALHHVAFTEGVDHSVKNVWRDMHLVPENLAAS